MPYSPGGFTDVFVRLTAKHLEPLVGQPIVVVNIKGAGGSISMYGATKAKPDGYTFGMYLTNTEASMATGVASFISVPGELSIAGFDDLDFAAPPLTNV